MGAMRIMTVAALAIGLGALGAGPALADDAAGASKPKKAKQDTSRKICRNLIPSGSRLSTRVCRTQEQWNQIQDETQDGLLQFQMKEQTTYAPMPG